MSNKKAAFWETNINIGIGFFLSWAVTEILLACGAFDILNSLVITCIFTVVSWTRSYMVRRHFDGIIKRLAEKMAA